MVMERWNPFAEMRQMQRQMQDLANWFWGTPSDSGPEAWLVPLDVYRHGDNIVVQASMPGFSPEDIEVTIEDGVLTIKGQTKPEQEGAETRYFMRERRAGQFYRSLRLPDSVDTDKAHTSYQHGVLTITFPIQEAKRARQLQVTAGGQPQAIEGQHRQVA